MSENSAESESHEGPQDLQFERADYGTQAAPPAPTCEVCHQPVGDVYFAVGPKIVCARCRDAILAELQPKGSRFGRLFRAFVFGMGAALVAAIVWYTIRRVTGYEIGLVAIVVGLFVGGAVRLGARGAGGLSYQLIAMFLTYSCIVSTYMPEVFTALRNDINQKAAATQPALATAAPTTSSTTGPTTGTVAGTTAGTTESPDAELSVGKSILAVGLLVLILFAIAFVAPVMAGFQSIIWLFIIGIALWEAWKINKRRRVDFTGPHRLSTTTAPGLSPPPSQGAAQ